MHTYLCNSWRTNFRNTHSMSDDEEHWMGDAPAFTWSHWWQLAHCYAKIRKYFGENASYYQLFGDNAKSGTSLL